MGKIEIRKGSITRMEVDAIVNAANEGLWAGGGVCGVIFSEAGHQKLQEACSRIGHCDTGSAVITPVSRTGSFQWLQVDRFSSDLSRYFRISCGGSMGESDLCLQRFPGQAPRKRP